MTELIKRQTLADTLDTMKAQGSSVLLNWGEDDNAWECSWITGGKRITGISLTIEGAVSECLSKARGMTFDVEYATPDEVEKISNYLLAKNKELYRRLAE